MSQTNGAVKTNFAQTWKRQTMVVDFPSGAQAEMTRPDALSLMSEDGAIPDMFFAAMNDAQSGKNPMEGLDASETRAFLKTIMYLAEQLALRHFVNPRIVENPDYENGEISIDDVKAMSMEDKQFLTNWAMNSEDPVDLLARFRQEKARRLAAASNGGEL